MQDFFLANEWNLGSKTQHSGIVLLHCTSETAREAIFNVTTKRQKGGKMGKEGFGKGKRRNSNVWGGRVVTQPDGWSLNGVCAYPNTPHCVPQYCWEIKTITFRSNFGRINIVSLMISVSTASMFLMVYFLEKWEEHSATTCIWRSENKL